MLLVRAALEKKAKPSRGGDAKPRGRTSNLTRVSRVAWSTHTGILLGGGAREVRKQARCHEPNPKGKEMLESIKQRLGRDGDEGFTLIELMVVVLIIAILLAIAIPTFLGARDSANARAAQSNLRNADTAEQTYWTNNQSWDTTPSTTTSGSVAQLESALVWQTTGATPGTNQISVSGADVTTDNAIMLAAGGKDNKCYTVAVVDQPNAGAAPAGTYYNVSNLPAAGTCSPAAGPLPTGGPNAGNASKNVGTSWYSSW
jgi:type IV pilus assembly protein PilA